MKQIRKVIDTTVDEIYYRTAADNWVCQDTYTEYIDGTHREMHVLGFVSDGVMQEWLASGRAVPYTVDKPTGVIAEKSIEDKYTEILAKHTALRNTATKLLETYNEDAEVAADNLKNGNITLSQWAEGETVRANISKVVNNFVDILGE